MIQSLPIMMSSINRNPYFIGILSAISNTININDIDIESQSLFYWNPFCNLIVVLKCLILKKYRNPYFIGILSAIIIMMSSTRTMKYRSQSLFYWNPFCNNLKEFNIMKLDIGSQSLFYWNPFCNEVIKKDLQ